MKNTVIETILNHRSIRKFKPVPLSEAQIDTIIAAAQSASTSSYMMAYSIIGITDLKLKSELAKITGQSYVKENGHLFIFCADLHRHASLGSEQQYTAMLENLENSEHFLVSAIDASLAAQNAAITAESMNLGICYIGSIRNNLERVDALLSLPKHVIPLFGMVVGVPDQQPLQKPRLPKEAVYFENEYKEHPEELQRFDRTIADYYLSRNLNSRQDTWTDQMLRRFMTPIRMDVTELIQKKSFNKK